MQQPIPAARHELILHNKQSNYHTVNFLKHSRICFLLAMCVYYIQKVLYIYIYLLIFAAFQLPAEVSQEKETRRERKIEKNSLTTNYKKCVRANERMQIT